MSQMRERRTVCESTLMPDGLLTGEDKRPMVRAVINESAKLGLIERNDEDIQIAPDALESSGRKRRIAAFGH